MWKVFLYHQWQYEKAEKFLMDMESEGYRLKRIRFSFLFEFAKASPKNVRYIFYITLSKTIATLTMKHVNTCWGAAEGRRYAGKDFLNPRFTE